MRPVTLWVGMVCLALGLVLGLMTPKWLQKKSAPMTSVDALVSKHDVQIKKPIKALDKAALVERKVIAPEIAKAAEKEVLATATISDDSGTRHVGAMLDTDTGLTTIVEKRPLAEWMSGNEIGIGYTAGSLGMGYAGQYRRTFSRLWKLYPDVRVDLWQWTSGARKDAGHSQDGQISGFLTLRF